MDLVQVHTKFLLALKQRKGRHGQLAEPLLERLEENSAEFQKNTPAPNKYRPVHFTEASHAYSISAPPEVDIKDI